MKLDTRALTLAAAVVAAVLYALCALLIALAPEATMRVAGYLMHVDLGGISRPISWGGVLAGLTAWTAASAACAYALAELYNRLARA